MRKGWKLIQQLLNGSAKQMGSIHFGAGLNRQTWIKEMRARGYTLHFVGEYAHLYLVK